MDEIYLRRRRTILSASFDRNCLAFLCLCFPLAAHSVLVVQHSFKVRPKRSYWIIIGHEWHYAVLLSMRLLYWTTPLCLANKKTFSCEKFRFAKNLYCITTNKWDAINKLVVVEQTYTLGLENLVMFDLASVQHSLNVALGTGIYWQSLISTICALLWAVIDMHVIADTIVIEPGLQERLKFISNTRTILISYIPLSTYWSFYLSMYKYVLICLFCWDLFFFFGALIRPLMGRIQSN